MSRFNTLDSLSMHFTKTLYQKTKRATSSDAITIRIGRVGLWLLYAITLLSSGCSVTATEKTVILSPFEISTVAPSMETVVYVREISDNRDFAIKAEEPATESVETVDVLAEIETGSMIGQWRTASGDVVADLLLEDSNRVTELVSRAVEEGFRRAGYRVVSVDRAQSENAVAVDGRILRFWTYQTGSWTFRFTFEIEVELTGDVADLGGGRRIETSEFLRSAVAGRPKSFGNTIDLGMEKFMETLADELR
jgi:hypothetical protein